MSLFGIATDNELVFSKFPLLANMDCLIEFTATTAAVEDITRLSELTTLSAAATAELGKALVACKLADDDLGNIIPLGEGISCPADLMALIGRVV